MNFQTFLWDRDAYFWLTSGSSKWEFCHFHTHVPSTFLDPMRCFLISRSSPHPDLPPKTSTHSSGACWAACPAVPSGSARQSLGILGLPRVGCPDIPPHPGPAGNRRPDVCVYLAGLSPPGDISAGGPPAAFKAPSSLIKVHSLPRWSLPVCQK